jgi:hypothetical protein
MSTDADRTVENWNPKTYYYYVLHTSIRVLRANPPHRPDLNAEISQTKVTSVVNVTALQRLARLCGGFDLGGPIIKASGDMFN